MKNNQIVDSWNRIEIDSAADTRMLHAILARKRTLDKKQERRETIFLCLVQIMMFVMTLSIVAIVLMISPGIAGVLISYVVFDGFISAIIILLYSKNIKRRVNSHD